jgi:hypothetical protein
VTDNELAAKVREAATQLNIAVGDAVQAGLSVELGILVAGTIVVFPFHRRLSRVTCVVERPL